MAADILPNIQPALAQTFAKRLVKAWNRQAITISQIPVVSDMGQGDAKQIAWDVEFSGAGAAAFLEGSDVAQSEFLQDPIVPAVVPWGMYRSAFKISNLEINAASRSIANATQLGDIVGLRLESAITKMLSRMNADFFTGTGSDANGNPTLVGLTSALSATGTYAGLSKAQYPEWGGNVLSNGGVTRPLTFDLLANMEQLIFIASGQEPDAIITSAGIARKYEGLFETSRQGMNQGDQNFGGSSGGYQGSTGPGVTGPRTNLYWRGKPVIRDRDCPANQLFMVKWSELEMKYLPFMPLSPDGVSVINRAMPSADGTNFVPTNISATVYPLARVGSAIPWVAEIYVQSKTARVNAHGWLSDIAEV